MESIRRSVRSSSACFFLLLAATLSLFPGYSLAANGAIKFSGTGYVSLTSPITPSDAAPFTVEMWILITDVNRDGGQGIFEIAGELHANGLFSDGNGGLCTANPNGDYTFASGIVSSVWTHVAITKSGSDLSTITLYVGGVQRDQKAVYLWANGTSMTLGGCPFMANYEGWNERMGGQIDEVRIWNVARTQEQIANTMNHEIDPATPGLAAYYKCNEENGTTLTNAVAGGTNGPLDGDASVRPGSAPLPVQLSSFAAASLNNASVLLRWTTASEVNNYGFYVQANIPAQKDFADIAGAFVAGHGTTTAAQSYRYTVTGSIDPKVSFRLKQVDLDGAARFSEPISLSSTGIEGSTPIDFALYQNYPNPFNPCTIIRYALPVNSFVRLSVYDALGRELAVLVNGEQGTGNREVRFDGAGLSSGVYFVRLSAVPSAGGELVPGGGQYGKKSAIQRILLLR